MAGVTGVSGRSERTRMNEIEDHDLENPKPGPAPKKKRVRAKVNSVSEQDMMTLSPEEIQNKIELFNKVFTNHLVCEEIAKALDVADMKNLSQTSRVLFEKIGETKHFQKNTFYPIYLKNFTAALHPEHYLDFVWKNVEIILEKPLRIEELEDMIPTIRRRLENTEYMNIYIRKGTDIDRVKDILTTNRILEAILSSALHLKSLTIPTTMLKTKLSLLLKDDHVKGIFKKLKEFHMILAEDLRNESFFQCESQSVERNFKELAGITQELSGFTCGGFTGLKIDFSSAIDIIKRSDTTLEYLSLEGAILKSPNFEDLTCSQLTKLRIGFNFPEHSTAGTPVSKISSQFYMFFEKLENIQELDICFRTYDTDLFKILQEKSKQWTLKRFRVHVHWRSNEQNVRPGRRPALNNFDVLKGIRLNSLRDFEIWVERSRLTYQQILPELPSDLTVMNLRDLKWDQTGSLASSLTFLEAELERFVYLVELSLLLNPQSFSGDAVAVDDNVMRCIFRHITKLRILRMSHCRAVTDRGFAPLANNANSFSIQNLKGLQKLVIVECPHLTDRNGLAKGIKLPELTFLMLVRDNGMPFMRIRTRRNRVSEIGLKTWKDIVGQNPKLSTVVMNNSTSNIAVTLKAINPSIRHVYNNIETSIGPDVVGHITSSSQQYVDQYTGITAYEDKEETPA